MTKTSLMRCHNCNNEFKASIGRVNRAARAGLNMYCKYSCFAEFQRKRQPDKEEVARERPIKSCIWCGVLKPLDEFHTQPKKSIDGRTSICKICRNAYNAEWARANRKQASAQQAAWRAANPERDKANKRRSHLKLFEVNRPKKAEWAAQHQTEVREYKAHYRENNLDKWKKYSIERRARKRGKTIENFLPIEIFERDNWICQICHEPIKREVKWPNPLSVSLDHRIPLAHEGGHHTRDNVQCAHMICNWRKWTKSMPEVLA